MRMNRRYQGEVADRPIDEEIVPVDAQRAFGNFGGQRANRLTDRIDEIRQIISPIQDQIVVPHGADYYKGNHNRGRLKIGPIDRKV